MVIPSPCGEDALCHCETNVEKAPKEALPIGILSCDYEDDCTELYTRIERGEFEAVVVFLDTGYWPGHFFADSLGPFDQARCRVTRYEPDSDKEKIRWSQLPLHLCLVVDAPFGVIRRLVELFPDGVTVTDDENMLPLHLAMRQGCSDEVVDFLLQAYPEAVHHVGKKNRTPIDCAMRSRKNARGRILSTFIAKIKSQDEREREMEEKARKVKEAAEKQRLMDEIAKKELALEEAKKELEERMAKQVEDIISEKDREVMSIKSEIEEQAKKELESEILKKEKELEEAKKEMEDKTKKELEELTKKEKELEKAKQLLEERAVKEVEDMAKKEMELKRAREEMELKTKKILADKYNKEKELQRVKKAMEDRDKKEQEIIQEKNQIASKASWLLAEKTSKDNELEKMKKEMERDLLKVKKHMEERQKKEQAIVLEKNKMAERASRLLAERASKDKELERVKREMEEMSAIMDKLDERSVFTVTTNGAHTLVSGITEDPKLGPNPTDTSKQSGLWTQFNQVRSVASKEAEKTLAKTGGVVCEGGVPSSDMIAESGSKKGLAPPQKEAVPSQQVEPIKSKGTNEKETESVGGFLQALSSEMIKAVRPMMWESKKKNVAGEEGEEEEPVPALQNSSGADESKSQSSSEKQDISEAPIPELQNSESKYLLSDMIKAARPAWASTKKRGGVVCEQPVPALQKSSADESKSDKIKGSGSADTETTGPKPTRSATGASGSSAVDEREDATEVDPSRSGFNNAEESADAEEREEGDDASRNIEVIVDDGVLKQKLAEEKFRSFFPIYSCETDQVAAQGCNAPGCNVDSIKNIAVVTSLHAGVGNCTTYADKALFTMEAEMEKAVATTRETCKTENMRAVGRSMGKSMAKRVDDLLKLPSNLLPRRDMFKCSGASDCAEEQSRRLTESLKCNGAYDCAKEQRRRFTDSFKCKGATDCAEEQRRFFNAHWKRLTAKYGGAEKATDQLKLERQPSKCRSTKNYAL